MQRLHETSVAPRPLVIVLTGGPSSRTSSALPPLRSKLSSIGFQVMIVPETATHFFANSDGFQAEWEGVEAQVRMQRIFIDYQLMQEEASIAFAQLRPQKPAILLLDRCTLDSKVFLSHEQWAPMLMMPGKPLISENDLLQRYDVVIHMETCAGHSSYLWGVGANNPARHHSPDEAKGLHEKSFDTWQRHSGLHIVPYMESLDEKVHAVFELVMHCSAAALLPADVSRPS